MSKRACGFVIFRRFYGNVEYLLMQASYQNHHWTPPKGHTKLGESDMDTALRETQEEAGLLKEDLKIFDVKQELNYLIKNNTVLKTSVYWLAELINKKEVTMSKEHQDFRWLPLEEACELAAYEEMQNLLKYFDKYISENLK